MNDYYDDSFSDGTTEGFWERLHPGLQSAIIFWVFLIAIALINSFTAGTSIIFCYPVQLLLYAANGALAAHFALESGYDSADLPRVGAIAGLIVWVLPALYYLVAVLILGFATLGIGFLGLAGWVLCGPVDLVIQAMLGAFGAWLYSRF